MFGGALNSFDAAAPDAEPPGIDMTSMIDITFLLIIFWLVVTSVTPAEPLRRLELPAANVTQSAGTGRPVIIDVTPEPVRPVYLMGRAFSAEELSARLAEQPLGGRDVVLRADRRCDAALVSKLARACYRHGARSVAFSLRTGGGGR